MERPYHGRFIKPFSAQCLLTLRGRILMACDLAEGGTRVHHFAVHPAAATAEFQRPPHAADM